MTKQQTALTILIKIIIVMAIAEFLFMQSIESLPILNNLNADYLSVVNVLYLAIISAPLIYIFVIRQFIKERDEAIKALSEQADTDPLTALLNRRAIDQRIYHTMAEVKRMEGYSAFLLIDLDKFKPINDKHGHDAGDFALKTIAIRLQNITREIDRVSRLGGDEFAVLAKFTADSSEVAKQHATSLAIKLLNSIKEPFVYNSKTLSLDASIGIRVIGSSDTDLKTIYKDADKAMYHAKNDPEINYYCFCD